VAALLSSPTARATMGLQGRAFVEAHHAWDASCSRLEGMLAGIARQHAETLRASA
jgi:hypothetical protein